MRIWALLLVGFCGCVRSQLGTCDDVLCPTDLVCVPTTNRCENANNVAACEAQAANTACVSETVSDGICIDAVCRPRGCGNGVIEADEVCDDGNTNSDDGCAADCRSDERCGNGVLDHGEYCDCGDSAAARPAGCVGANSDDVGAQCDTRCTRYCGDGAITGSEDCERNVASTSTCADFGFYAGELSCSPSCRFETATCAGRCGDGVVQIDNGEECDQNIPDQSCVAVGFDYGAIECNPRCYADIASFCKRFGWQRLGNGSIDNFWAFGSRRVMYDEVHSMLTVHANGTDEVSAGALQMARNQSAAVVATATTFRVFDAAGEHPVAIPPSLVGSIYEVAIDSASRVSAVDNACVLYRQNGATWTTWTITAPDSPEPAPRLLGCRGLAAVGPDDFVVAAGSQIVAVHTGAEGPVASSLILAGTAPQVGNVASDGSVMVAAYDSGPGPNFYAYRAGQLSQVAFFTSASAASIEVVAGRRLFATTENGFEGGVLALLRIFDGDQTWQLNAPLSIRLFLAADQKLYGYGNGLYEAEEFIASESYFFSERSVQGLALGSHNEVYVGLDDYAFGIPTPSPITGLAARGDQHFVISNGLLEHTTASPQWLPVAGVPTDVSMVRRSSSNQVFAANRSALYISETEGAAFISNRLSPVSGCSSTLWVEGADWYNVWQCPTSVVVQKHVSNRWQTIDTVPRTANDQVSSTQAPDGTLLVLAGQQIFRYDQSGSDHFDAPAMGIISARSRDEVFLLPHRNQFEDDALWRWQQARWTPIDIDRHEIAERDYLLATPLEVVVGSAVSGQFIFPSQVIRLFRSNL